MRPTPWAHRAVSAARALVDDARDALAGVLGVDAGDVVFTGGGTEADNLAVLGRHAAVGGRVLCSAVEHPAVLGGGRRGGRQVVGTDSAG